MHTLCQSENALKNKWLIILCRKGRSKFAGQDCGGAAINALQGRKKQSAFLCFFVSGKKTD